MKKRSVPIRLEGGYEERWKVNPTKNSNKRNGKENS